MVASPLHWLQMGGPAMYGLVALFLLVSTVLLVCAGATFAGWRVPAPLWLGGPILTVLAGEAGVLHGQRMMTEALAYSTPEMVTTLTWAGHSVALYPGVAGLYGGCLLMLGVLWLLGLALILAPGENPRWTPVPSALGLAIPLLGAPAVAALAIIGKTGPSGWLPAVFLVAACLPLALGCAREGGPEKRAHTGRQVLAAALLLGTAWCALGGYHLGDSALYQAMSWGDPAFLMEVEAEGLASQRDVTITGGLSVLVALLAASCAMVFSLRHSFDARSVVGALLIGLALVAHLALEAWILFSAAEYLA